MLLFYIEKSFVKCKKANKIPKKGTKVVGVRLLKFKS